MLTGLAATAALLPPPLRSCAARLLGAPCSAALALPNSQSALPISQSPNLPISQLALPIGPPYWSSPFGNQYNPLHASSSSRCLPRARLTELCTHQHIFEEGNEDEEDDEERVLGVTGAIFWLAMITVGISFLSEWMVDAIRGAAHGLGVPDLFLGTIIIPIVGNAAEHAAAIIFAAKNKMELSLGIAVGSATQIALFVLPACVLIGWAYDLPLDLNLHPFELSVLAFAVLLVGVVIQQGQSHWLLGFILVCSYVVVAMGFFVHTDPLPTGEPLFVPVEAPAHGRN